MSKIWAISDTHGLHEELRIPRNIDTVIHTGDGGTYREPSLNEKPFRDFLDWFSELPMNNKIYSPGNHDTAFAARYIEPDEYPKIQFLVNEVTMLDNNLIYASPYTPEFGVGWAYNMNSNVIQNNWEGIPDKTNILLTHGPPYGRLDVTSGQSVGCPSLMRKVIKGLPDLKLHIFGHIHDEGTRNNYGMYIEDGKVFVNASVVDLRHNVVNNGHIISIK